MQANLQPDGTNVGFYTSNRVRVTDRLTAEAGLRYDRTSYTSDSDISPRLSTALALSDRSVLRVGWGTIDRPRGIEDLDAPFGNVTYYPSQRAEHRVIGFEHSFHSGVHLRVEAYQKVLTDIRPRYENLSKEVLFFPELEESFVFLEPDEGEARGLELYARKDTGGKLTWWASYSLARAEETFAGEEVPKNQDQRHTFYFDTNYRPSRKWSFNMAWQIRSGWPYSERIFVPAVYPTGEFPFDAAFGPRNARRLPIYHRLDVRISRHFELGEGRATVFAEVFNLYDRGNVQARLPGNASWAGPGSPVVLEGHFDEEWLPLMPSIGFRWDF